MRLALLVPLSALLLGVETRDPRPTEPPGVVANDNRTPAGTLAGGVLTLHLVAQTARWSPETEDGPSVVVAALGEEGKAPSIPAPFIRVPLGTRIRVTVRNLLPDSALIVHGLSPGGDSLVVRPGDVGETGFTATAAGTFLYWATRGNEPPFGRGDPPEEEQLAGAIVVDPPGGSPPDRVWVINIWSDPGDSTVTPARPFGSALTINGKSWPYTERVETPLGDSVRWRWVNASRRMHPMHLHGFYYRMTARGGALADTVIPPADQRLTVTEVMEGRTTMALAFAPDRPGNWLFHCHLIYHVLATLREELASAAGRHHEHDPREHMAGLVLGFQVPPDPAWRERPRVGTRRIRLLALDEPRPGSAHGVRMGFALDRGRGPEATRPDRVAPLLVLNRGIPADVRVVNRMAEPTAIHWHGVELESWSDGVAGWSGSGLTVAPMIVPGDSFTARLTLPRPGTFIYHTHFNDERQLESGMYGPIIVLPPGARHDPGTDHVFLLGLDGPASFRTPLLVNGDTGARTLRLGAGRAHRFRLINIMPAGFVRVTWTRDGRAQEWRAVAKDGADLPAAQARPRPATTVVAVGQTEDYLVTPAPGTYQLTFHRPGRRDVDAVLTVEVR